LLVLSSLYFTLNSLTALFRTTNSFAWYQASAAM
jgi:hypothetical protein